MKRTPLVLTLAGFATFLRAQDVIYNFDQSVNFATYKTFRWIHIPGGGKLDDLLARQLDSAVQVRLGSKRLVKTDSDNADLYIGYQVAISEEKEMAIWGTGPRYFGGGMANVQTSTLKIGSVDLDMYNSSRQLVWRGVATKTIDSGAKPDKRQKNIEKGVEKLLKNYPPKQKTT